MIELPPSLSRQDLDKAIRLSTNPDIHNLVTKINRQYDHWSDVKYKQLPADITHKELWACVKLSRMFATTIALPNHEFRLYVTDQMQRLCHDFDMNLGGYLGAKSTIPIAAEDKNRFLINSTMEEAIASSQMEGAATTRKIAKNMLRKSMSPRTLSEQMIYNNYQTIRFIADNKDEPLSRELLLHIHHLMSHKTLDSTADEGRFRTDNDVVVENAITHETIHTPPDYTQIDSFVDGLCNMFNDNPNDDLFIHPIINGIIIHFLIGFIHPFVDGNGRTARAVFYWYMLRKGYWLTEYLSISRTISRSKNQYEKAYQFTENDQNDLGYFVAYNLRVISLAYNDLQQYIERQINKKQQTSDFLKLGNINFRQAQILKWYNDTPSTSLSAREIQNRMGVSFPTAKADLDKLVEMGFIVTKSVNKIKNNYIRSDNFDKLTE